MRVLPHGGVTDREACNQAKQMFDHIILGRGSPKKQLECATRLAYWYMKENYPNDSVSWGRFFEGWVDHVTEETNQRYILAVRIIPDRCLLFIASLGTRELLKHILNAAEYLTDPEGFH